mmetsp:Transcript_4369/g.10689  ORF Transcript_4369/g.10689 Transcript_4369/m.10689 type:complete len:204 (-) Transcript_4369:857-1468(-)
MISVSTISRSMVWTSSSKVSAIILNKLPAASRVKHAMLNHSSLLVFTGVPGQDSYFFKSSMMLSLDDDIGDIYASIRDKELKVIQDVQAILIELLEDLEALKKMAAILDCLLSFAVTAQENNWVVPTMTDDKVHDTVDGRHPLQEVAAASFIPNGFHSDGESPLHSITGPNCSGKSVYSSRSRSSYTSRTSARWCLPRARRLG